MVNAQPRSSGWSQSEKTLTGEYYPRHFGWKNRLGRACLRGERPKVPCLPQPKVIAASTGLELGRLCGDSVTGGRNRESPIIPPRLARRKRYPCMPRGWEARGPTPLCDVNRNL